MLELKNLSAGYKNFKLRIGSVKQASKLIFVAGPNGSGKSTLLKTIAGILKPQSGEVFFESYKLIYTSDPTKRPIFLGSSQLIQEGLKVTDLLDLFETKNSKWMSDELLNDLNISNLIDKNIEQLSSGERQRVLLACALGHPSNLVILDEPLSFLDWQHALQLQNIILKMSSTRTFLISNHNLDWSLKFRDGATWVLYQNELKLQGKTADVLVDLQFMEIFKIRTQITDNPLDKSQHLVIAMSKKSHE